MGCRLDREFAGKTVRKEDFATWDVRRNDITFVPTGETHEFALSGEEDMEWKIFDVHSADSNMRTDKMKGCSVSLNEHFVIVNTKLVWSNLPSPDALLADQEKWKAEGFKKKTTTA